MKHITMEDWKNGGSFCKIAEPGDTVDDDVIEEFRNVLPPLINRKSYLQCGEPVSYSFDYIREKYRQTFITFSRDAAVGSWLYHGTCFSGEMEHREGNRW